MGTYRSVCPLDCFDTCNLLIKVEDNKVTSIEGNPEHPITKGYICSKGRKHLKRLYSSDRILNPLQKVNGVWKKITWEEAYDIIAEKLQDIKSKYGSTAVLHNYDYGSGGVLKALDQRFFNAFGGVTVPVGSLCWGAGLAAQSYDFGTHRSHQIQDHINSKVILVWGRNPVNTNLHMMNILKEAKKNGAKIIVINPNKIPLGNLADDYISPRPGTDGALALGIAYVLLENRWIDLEFIKNKVSGFSEYISKVKDYPPVKVAEITGVSVEEITQLAKVYSHNVPGSIILGMGLQRYSNGGNTIRAINALAALTGNIGIAGGGINYGHSYNKEILQSIAGKELATEQREFVRGRLGQEILDADNPPIKAIFVTRSNPVTQLPYTSKVIEAFNKAEFKVVIDFFLTDTAEMADLVLPCTTFMEEEDLVATSWTQYISYVPKLIEPQGNSKPDWVIFTELANRMGLENFGSRSAEEWLSLALEPASKKFGLRLEQIKTEGFILNPAGLEIPWQDGQFLTPSGKVELYSQKAVDDGCDGVAIYREPTESIISQPKLAREYPLVFLTVHHADTLHSQFSNLIEEEKVTSLPIVELNKRTAEERYIRDNDVVIVESPRGEIRGLARVSEGIREDVVQMYEGWWNKESHGVNFLTPDTISDMGQNASYYDCLCQVRKLIS